VASAATREFWLLDRLVGPVARSVSGE